MNMFNTRIACLICNSYQRWCSW